MFVRSKYSVKTARCLMEGEFGTQDYKMQILVDLKSQILEVWMAKHCYVNTMVACYNYADYISLYKSGISVKLTGTQKHITGN